MTDIIGRPVSVGVRTVGEHRRGTICIGDLFYHVPHKDIKDGYRVQTAIYLAEPGQVIPAAEREAFLVAIKTNKYGWRAFRKPIRLKLAEVVPGFTREKRLESRGQEDG